MLMFVCFWYESAKMQNFPSHSAMFSSDRPEPDQIVGDDIEDSIALNDVLFLCGSLFNIFVFLIFYNLNGNN